MITNYGTMVVGERTRLISTAATLELYVEQGAALNIGAGSLVNYGCSIAATSLIRIGSRCNIGTHVIIMDNDYHELAPERRHIRPASAPIILEDDVWICARSIILRGVTIGWGSVIGAGSVVTRDIPPRSLAAGQPARVIRSI
ncbi:MAG: acyltransferase [Hyphomicrobiaceae bacterium]|uniref:acyltransferase n=1 Tax=Pseudorhodoplanes sp. TaxID=1934341 RepID=UPI003D1072C8